MIPAIVCLIGFSENVKSRRIQLFNGIAGIFSPAAKTQLEFPDNQKVLIV